MYFTRKSQRRGFDDEEPKKLGRPKSKVNPEGDIFRTCKLCKATSIYQSCCDCANWFCSVCADHCSECRGLMHNDCGSTIDINIEHHGVDPFRLKYCHKCIDAKLQLLNIRFETNDLASKQTKTRMEKQFKSYKKIPVA